jgi:hypothetical protein
MVISRDTAEARVVELEAKIVRLAIEVRAWRGRRLRTCFIPDVPTDSETVKIIDRSGQTRIFRDIDAAMDVLIEENDAIRRREGR